MHEFAVTQSILSIVLQKAREVNARKVTKIDLKIGRLTGYVPECIQQQFDILSHNTEAVGAKLNFHQPPSDLHCRKCDISYQSEFHNLACPCCHTMEIDILSGSELYVESIEIE